MNRNIVLISGDAHAGATPEGYRPYMEPLALEHFDDYVEDNERRTAAMSVFTAADGPFNEERTAFVDRGDAFRSGGVNGAQDLERRLMEMDREGICGEVLFLGPQNAMEPFFTPSNRPTPLDVRAAGLRAFHRWLADHVVDADGRLIPMADTAGNDMAATIKELAWCADHGFGGVQLPGLVTDPVLPPLYDSYYEPLWSACVDTRFVLQMHAGWGAFSHGFGVVNTKREQLVDRGKNSAMDQGMMKQDPKFGRIEGRPARAMWQMMAGGVFDRHPTLKLVLTELRADWVPATLAALDARVAAGDTPMKMLPSEYFARNCFIAPSSPRDTEVALRHQIGVDRFIFGRDYPHPEGTWPNTYEWIQAAFAGVPENEARLMLGENAIDCFGFDRAKMEKIAERIGPKPETVLGQHPIDPKLIEHFDLRSGYSKDPIDVDVDALTQAMNEDLAGLGAH